MHSRSIISCSIWLLLGLLVSGFSTPLSDAWDRFDQANKLYQDKQFAEAAEQYEQLVAEGTENGHLYYNLGNTYYRLGQYGLAIQNYLKAKHHLPRDEEVESNLLFSINETQDKLDWQGEGSSGSIFFWIKDLTLKEHLVYLLYINLAFWVVQAVKMYRTTWGTSLARSVALGILAFAVFSTGLRWNYDAGWNYEVVLAKRLEVLSGPEKNNSALFHLHEGAIVTIVENNGDWKRIQLPDGKKGWVRAPGKELGATF